MGHTQTSFVVVRIEQKESPASDKDKSEENVTPLSIESCDTLGAMSFDICLFRHFASIVEKKSGEKVHFVIICFFVQYFYLKTNACHYMDDINVYRLYPVQNAVID